MAGTDFGIDWNEFAQHAQQGGDVDPSSIDALNKALSAGDGQAVPDSAVAGALAPVMPESLEGTLASLTFTEESFPFWAKLTKDRAYNTAEEYNQLLQVGQGEAGFIGEGDLPEEEDSTYRRRVTLIKFLGVTRRVTHVASLVRTAGINSAVAAETRDGTVWLMRVLEEGLFYGDSTLIPIQFDGLKKQLIDGGATVYDNRGAPLNVRLVNGLTAVVRRRPNYGKVSTLFSSVGVKSDVVNDLLALLRERFGASSQAGLEINSIKTQNGTVELVDDIFIEEGTVPHPAGLGNTSKRPLTPVSAGAITSPVAAAGTSLFAAADVGAYIYKIVAVNRYGRSAPLTTAAATPAAGDEFQIPIMDGGQGTTCYIVYRSDMDGDASTCKEAFRVARTGMTQTIVDKNHDLPGTSDVFGITFRADVLKWKQLAPFTKLPLATVDTSIRWMMVLYGALQVRKPRHNFVIKNVGRDPNSPLTDATVGLDGF